jgi:hypothetical protein
VHFRLNIHLYGLFLGLLLIPQLGLAAFSNYNSILIGDQAAGMGGAATAVVGDASSCSWYNPATCALLRGRSFSAAVGIYKKFDTIYGENADLIKAGLKVNQGFFRPLPSSTGSIVRFKDIPIWTFAFTIVTPEYDTFKGDLLNSNNSKTALTLTDESLWVGGSISRPISSNEAVGLTLYYTARNFSKTLTDRTFASQTSTNIYQEEKGFTQNAIVGTLGYYIHLNQHWNLGFSWRMPSYHVAGNATYFDSYLESGTTTRTNNYSSLASPSHIPQRYNIGISYEEKSRFTLAMDISNYSKESYKDLEVEQAGIAEEIQHNPIWNMSLGGEYFFKPWLKGRIGFFSNLSAHPTPDIEKVRGQGDHIDQFGWSANLALRSGRITYTFGGYYSGGRGLSSQRINQQVAVIAKTQQVSTMLVGTSYSF